MAAPREAHLLPFPMAAGYYALALNGAKGGGTKYITLQFLNYARWTAQQNSCSVAHAVKIIMDTHVRAADGSIRPWGILRMWHPHITFVNETVHWGMKVPLAMKLYGGFYDAGWGPHLGLFTAVALSSAGEAALTGWSERFGVHMGLRQIKNYGESYRISRDARGGPVAGAWAGISGLWLRNFTWNFAFFEWKRFMHNAVDRTPEGAPGFLTWHLEWLRSLDKKDMANLVTFECATLATYLTFFNMAGDNIKTKMQYDPVRYNSVVGTVKDIYANHGLVGFARGSLFKGVYLILGATLAISIQERLTDIMATLMHR